MKTRNQLFDFEKQLNEIKTLNLHLFLTNETIPLTPFQKASKNKELGFSAENGIWFLYDTETKTKSIYQPTLNELIFCIQKLKKEPAQESYFDNRWDEIEKITGLNMGQNRVIEGGLF